MNAETRSRLVIKVSTLIAIVLTAGVALTIGLLMYWSLQNPAVIDVKNAPFPVRPGRNAPGQVEIVKINYCKTFRARGEVVARMVGKKSIIRIPWPADTQPPQCLDTEIPIVIPTYSTDDTYHFDFTITYRINPLKDKVVYLKSQDFTVSRL